MTLKRENFNYIQMPLPAELSLLNRKSNDSDFFPREKRGYSDLISAWKRCHFFSVMHLGLFRIKAWLFILAGITGVLFAGCRHQPEADQLKEAFKNPPPSARPGVYWYFMDGNLSREGMTADLESMKKAGIGNVLFLEVNVGVPRGKVDFLSETWQELYTHAVKEAERLGIEVTLGSGPGWAGSGGPWVRPEQSMRHLVASEKQINGPGEFKGKLAVAPPRRPYFGEGVFTGELKEAWEDYYEDVFVVAFPTPEADNTLEDVDEKALYYRAPFTSVPGVKPYLPAPAGFTSVPGAAIGTDNMIDLTDQMQGDGELTWQVPPGEWTIMRFGVRNNGAVTRPAPLPGLGFEADKFDTVAFNAHFDEYVGKLLQKTGPRKENSSGGWTMIHIDSWEMGAQNWSDHFREEFRKRRGYDPLKFFPTYLGKIVESLEISERFLWDVRQTSMELILENHAGHFKELGRRNGFTLSIEPYDMNPTADLDLGAVADVPMCEFWTKGLGYNSSFSCLEATSIAHVHGRPVVAAEAFTAGGQEAWKMYPGNVKNQGDWAFCMGINKFVYHTFAHKPLGEQYRPGMTMGPYGVHWDRGQTWWPLAADYHQYIARCQHVLRQGKAVAEILYLTPEGAPQVFQPPASALEGDPFLPDKKGYRFDGCSPRALIEKAEVRDNQIVFPEGTSYQVLVLPQWETMTPELLQKIETLVENGAVVVGSPPVKSPSLTGYPGCDLEVEDGAKKLWGTLETLSAGTITPYGKGKIFHGGPYAETAPGELYPDYETIADLLRDAGIKENFKAPSGALRYEHRMTAQKDIFFVSNRTSRLVGDICTFRTTAGAPELWDPVTGEIKPLEDYTVEEGQVVIPMTFEEAQSFFVVFDRNVNLQQSTGMAGSNFPVTEKMASLEGSWEVSFDPRWGGPEKITFDELTDWSVHPDEGVRYYSGRAAYHKTFDLPEPAVKDSHSAVYLHLGKVNNLARVILNGKDLGVVWTSPWRVDITGAVEEEGNQLEIEVANLWANRLIGDEQYPWDGIQNGQWPDWLLQGEPRPTERYTFTTYRYYKEDSPLMESGLIGPVTLQAVKK